MPPRSGRASPRMRLSTSTASRRPPCRSERRPVRLLTLPCGCTSFDLVQRPVSTPGGLPRSCVPWSAAASGELLVDDGPRDTTAAGNLNLVLAGPFAQLDEVVAAG